MNIRSRESSEYGMMWALLTEGSQKKREQKQIPNSSQGWVPAIDQELPELCWAFGYFSMNE